MTLLVLLGKDMCMVPIGYPDVHLNQSCKADFQKSETIQQIAECQKAPDCCCVMVLLEGTGPFMVIHSVTSTFSHIGN